MASFLEEIKARQLYSNDRAAGTVLIVRDRS
jgi:hypothetical protein